MATSSQIQPAGRACLACGVPLSIYEEDERCLRCVHSYRLVPMNPLQRKVTAAQRTNSMLSNVPRFDFVEATGS